MLMRQNSFLIAAFAVMLPVTVAAQPLVQSQEGIALENQILQLQNQVQQLQSSGGSALGGSAQPAAPAPDATSSGTAPSSDILGNLLNQVSQLQAQVQQLNGRVDTLQNEVDTQHAAAEKEIGDLNFKISGGTGGAPSPAGAPQAPGAPESLTNTTLGTTSAGQPPMPPSPPAPLASSTPASPRAALEAAEAALAHHQFADAESNARIVLAAGKSSPEGYKAQYILAEALYGEGKPQDAAIAYDDAYNSNRSGTYAPGSLLGLANSLTDIQQQSAACDTLSSLNSQFPSPPAGMAPRILAAEARAKCN
jgi:TolA-binding protein